jgi:hypothetical protein
VNDLAEDGDRTKAQYSLNTARVLIIVGAVAGVVIATIWNVYRVRSMHTEEDQNNY